MTLGWQDPLDVVPRLLSCNRDGSDDLLALLGECGSPKEIIIAAQEAVERFDRPFDDEDTSGEGLTPAAQLGRLMALYASCW